MSMGIGLTEILVLVGGMACLGAVVVGVVLFFTLGGRGDPEKREDDR